MNIRRIVAVAGAAMLGLVAKPSAGASYTDVSYITTSAANQDWVRLDYTPKASTILEATVEIPASGYGQTHTPFCARGKDAADRPFVCFISSAKNWRFDFNENGSQKQGGAYVADTKYLIRAEASGFYVDGVKVVTPTTVPADFVAANKLVLFASYNATSSAVEPIASAGWSELKVYGVRIWEGSQTEENLIHDLRPCSDSNGKFCLRDAKNGDTPYYSRGVKGFGGPALSLSVAIVDEDIGVPHLTATDAGPDATVSFLVSRSADGPWEEFATVPSTERGTAEADDETAAVGVPLYYRAECDVPGIGASPVVSITRLCSPLPYISMKEANHDWVLLNYTPNSNTIFEATVEIPASRYGKTHTLFCARGNDAADHPFVCSISSAKNWRFDFNENGSQKQGGAYVADTPYLVRAEASGLYVDGVKVVTPSSAPNFEAANKLVLFAAYLSQGDEPVASGSWSEIKVYGVRIWEGEKTDDKLLYDLRPYKDENGRYCLRDAKNGDKLYYSLGNGFGGYVADLKVSVEDFGSCVPQVKLLGLEDEVTDVTLQYARSAEGPWTTFASAAAPTDSYVKAANPDAVVGVAMYYRASYVQAGVQCFSSPVPFTRFRRLERDPANERGGLVEGCSTPLEWGTADYTNGVRTAFDGKPETFPDTSPFGKTDGATKVGIDFGEEGAYVACVRAMPTWAGMGMTRVNGTKLYAADDTDLSDAVAISPALSCSGTYTSADAQAGRIPFSVVYAQDASVPHRFYYLYKDGWYGNVAEMQLYGWTSKDQKQSGELIPPTVFAERGSEADSIVVSWIGGANIETLELQRRVVGTGAWLTVASGLTGSTYTDKKLAMDRTYEYQLIVQGNGKTLEVVGESPVLLYTAGDGTGLRGVIYGPIASAECKNNQTKQCTYHEFRTDATIDFNGKDAADILYASTNLVSGLVIWRGKLIVPTDGEYTIGIEVDAYDGYALTIDETELGNRYTGQAAGRKAAAVALTAGEHPIEVQWASRARNGIRKCRLFWALEGKIAEETIPATQLKPAADSELPVYSRDGLSFALPLGYGLDGNNWGYEGATVSAPYLPHFDGVSDDGTLQIRAGNTVMDTAHISIFGRPVKGPFRAELTIRKNESDSDCRPGLYVTAGSPIRRTVGFVVNPADCGVVLCPAHDPNVHMSNFGTWMKANDTQTETKLRVTRDKEGTLHFRCRNEATGNKWVECYTYIGGTNCVDETGTQGSNLCPLTSETLYVGFGGIGTKSVAHDLKIQEGTPGLILLLR